ncbi:MAG TPA: hypothetical protein VJP76_04065, partial [Candidatus Tumulicola sp.]|nr:hypothetical protein [Candidatus Tumulicola sp.]
MKWPIFACAAFVAAALFSPVLHAGRAAAVAATPSPAAFQYDEITRTVFPPATPPAPGNFSTDYAVAAAATPVPPLPKMNLGMMFNPAAQRAMAQQMQAIVNTQHLVRYTYYRGWIRRDDPVAQTATIEKCDEHRYVKLDLAKRTYSTIDQAAACATVPAQPMTPPAAAQMQEQPGTVDVSAVANNTSLGPLSIDGIATTGWNRDVEVKLTNATGSCRNADLKVTLQQYVSTIKMPRRFCPLPRGGMSALAAAGATRGGCTPKVDTAHGSFDVDSAGLGVGSS